MTPFSDAEVTAAWEAKLAERDAEIERLKGEVSRDSSMARTHLRNYEGYKAAMDAKVADLQAEVTRLKKDIGSMSESAAKRSVEYQELRAIHDELGRRFNKLALADAEKAEQLATERARMEYVWQAWGIAAKLGITGQHGDIRALIDQAKGATDAAS